MGLTSSLLIGRTALSASQLALQVTGNNISNAATEGYHRQRVELSPERGSRVGLNFIGRGVGVSDVSRAIDPALVARLRGARGQESAAVIERNILDNIEALTNELTGADLSSELSRFFNSWSELANNPTAGVTRASVVEQGASIAAFVRSMRTDLLSQRRALDAQLASNVSRADTLLTEIAGLNAAIVNAEQGAAQDGALRDQRGTLIDELSGLVEITALERESGAVDILVNSQAIVLGADSQGLELDIRSLPVGSVERPEGGISVRVLTKRGGEELAIESGAIGSLLANRETSIQGTIDDLDTLTSQLIFEVNRIHSTGRAGVPQRDLTGGLSLGVLETAMALNDPGNTTIAELGFGPSNGSFTVVVTDGNGNRAEQTIFVDLDGVDSGGALSTADDTSLDDIATALNGVANLNASVDGNGRLRITTDAGYEVHFEDDSSGVLAVLGVNSFFDGADASDIAVRADLRTSPEALVLGLGDGDNSAALSIAALADRGVDGLDGATITEMWLGTVERNAVNSASARTRLDSLVTVRQSLEAQERAVGGVSMDEESINLITYQQQYTGAARFLSVVDELTQTLLSLV